MITDLTLLETAAALQRGEFSSRELTQACLERITSLEQQLHAFLHIAQKPALQQAEAADKKLAEARLSGETVSSLLGIPLAVKDVLAVEELPCTCGSRMLEGYIPPFTATAVKRAFVGTAGIIAVDDYYDRRFPGVCAATHTFLQSGENRFVPFLLGHNKLYLCRPAFAGHYLRRLIGKGPFLSNLGLEKMYEHPVLIAFAGRRAIHASEAERTLAVWESQK